MTGKYKYRSSFRPPSDEDILGSVIADDIIEEGEEYDDFSLGDSTVVEKFIRVIESSSNPKVEVPSSNTSAEFSTNTREDIRRKLAFNKSETTPEVKPKSNKKNDLEGLNYISITTYQAKNVSIFFSEAQPPILKHRRSLHTKI